MYSVRWERSALLELAELWTNADAELRARITAATRVVDQALRTDADKFGESRGDEYSVGFAAPLGLDFDVVPQHRTVWVLHVWLVHKRGR
jgi:hypothetical protein